MEKKIFNTKHYKYGFKPFSTVNLDLKRQKLAGSHVTKHSSILRPYWSLPEAWHGISTFLSRSATTFFLGRTVSEGGSARKIKKTKQNYKSKIFCIINNNNNIFCIKNKQKTKIYTKDLKNIKWWKKVFKLQATANQGLLLERRHLNNSTQENKKMFSLLAQGCLSGAAREDFCLYTMWIDFHASIEKESAGIPREAISFLNCSILLPIMAHSKQLHRGCSNCWHKLWCKKGSRYLKVNIWF